MRIKSNLPSCRKMYSSQTTRRHFFFFWPCSILEQYCKHTRSQVKKQFVVLVLIFNEGPSEVVQKWVILHDRFGSTCCISSRVSCKFLKNITKNKILFETRCQCFYMYFSVETQVSSLQSTVF